ncbi:MAG TPA: tRNA (adenosine(37)-N6)-threonylcarbamoyltransferase complex ATPase subunit type 1 TsaE [Candidatus Paceibacterota bacterium]|nr:tRNA (adenosine(37)-N6)-threonylcarbamoyltransferase complex ATPase subunit type 1 TsaE [Candidatus Paceibacterota bacterium]
MIWQSSSSAATKNFGAAYAKRLLRRGRRTGAVVVGLIGDLGSGKTTFVQGFFRGVGARGRAVSPTFIIMRRATISRGDFRNLYHLDAYRLDASSEIEPLGLKTILAEPTNIVLVEWAERLRRVLPRRTEWIRFAHGQTPSSRTIRIERRLENGRKKK